MATPSTSTAKSPSNNNPKPVVEPVKAVDPQPQADTQPAEPAKTESPATPAPANEPAKTAEKTILSLSVSEKFARNCRMLAKLTGRSISDLVISHAEGEIKTQLRAALAELREDVE